MGSANHFCCNYLYTVLSLGIMGEKSPRMSDQKQPFVDRFSWAVSDRDVRTYVHAEMLTATVICTYMPSTDEHCSR